MPYDFVTPPSDTPEDVIRFPRLLTEQGRTNVPPRARIDYDCLKQAGYLTPDSRESALAETFRHIENPILQTAFPINIPDTRRNLLMVTSPQAEDGKTFCAINLAMSIALLEDTRVLLIDANMKRPGIARRLGIEATTGLVELMAGTSLTPADVTIQTDLANLAIIPSGQPNSRVGDGWISRRMRLIVQELALEDPDRLIIFDTPPVLECSSTSLIAGYVGQALMVVGSGRTKRHLIDKALLQIQCAEEIKLVINRR